MTPYRHVLLKVDEIVLLSGFNNLDLARMPESSREDHGTFLLYHRYHEARNRSGRRSPQPATC